MAPKADVKVLGVDPSLSSTGYAYRHEGVLVTGTITTSPLRGPHRLFYLRAELEKVLDRCCPDLVVYEGYAMGARGNNMFHLGELGGIFKTLLWERGIDFVEIPPTVMKSVIALKGRAEKQHISLALKVRFGIHVTQHDEADAVGLMLVGEIKSGMLPPPPKTPQLDRFESLKQSQVIKGKLKLISKFK